MTTSVSTPPAVTTSFSTPPAERPIHAYAAMAARERLEPYEYIPASLGPHDVEVTISHCGICHTDLHLIDDQFGMSTFPLVPGHEIIGAVAAVGSTVTHLRVGQRVGIGPLARACFTCEQCTRGRENLCSQAQILPMAAPGGYATRIRVDARCAYPIPASLSSEAAAPLLCAGVTVFVPLLRYARSAARVGVIGVGGLGHLALQFARAMGCDVTAFSSSAKKEAEAKRFGASEFVVSDSAALAARAGQYDVILSTAPTDVRWGDYLMALKPEGTLCVLGVPETDLAIPALPLLFGQRREVGSLIGSGVESRMMLDFAARHGIAPQLEVRPMPVVNDALDKLRRNEVRYRTVLTN